MYLVFRYIYNIMIRTGDIVRSIASENPLLVFGLRQRLFNLSSLAAYLKPQVEVRAKRSISLSAILMSLSRYQRQIKHTTPQRDAFCVDRIDIQRGLVTYTYPKSDEVQQAVRKLGSNAPEKTKRMSMTEGTTQIMLIVDESSVSFVEQSLPKPFLYRHRNICAIGLSFDKRYVEFPGMLYIVLQQVSLQNINVVEMSSTYTELVLYIDEHDSKLAFETLYSLFQR